MPLTPAEKRLAAAAGLEAGPCELLKRDCGGPLKRLVVFGGKSKPTQADAVAVAVEREQAPILAVKLRPKLLPLGYLAVWTDLYSAKGDSSNDAVAILKSTDESAVIRLQGSNGGNYDVSNDDILKKIKSWRGCCELQVIGAGSAWVAIEFASLPKDVCALAEEIYEFCPDSVEQGVGLQNEKDDPEKFKRARRLFPKLSAGMERKLKKQNAALAKMKIPAQLREMFKTSGFTTPTDMGIRLLALDLQESKQLFLWWD